MNWNLNGGVLIIGSLLWQNDLKDENDNIRLSWRNAHLDIEHKIPVKVPIRYGRKSRSNIMTMVFSNRMAKRKGFGYVVPFKKKINNQEDLLNECYTLSEAEGMGGCFVTSWGGLLAYLLNDLTISEDIKKEISRFFRHHKNRKFNIEEFKVGRERSCITKSLKLDIDWIDPIVDRDKSKINDLHLLLATPTKPLDRIPTIKEIAETVKTDNKRYYFINNVTNGIITQEDFEISKNL